MDLFLTINFLFYLEKYRKIDLLGVPMSCLRLAAGLAAALSYVGLFGKSFNLAPSSGFGWVNAGLCELLYTSLGSP